MTELPKEGNEFSVAEFTAASANILPSVSEPDGEDDIADHTFIIRWTDSDLDDDAQVSLYYDTGEKNSDYAQSERGRGRDRR